MNFRAMTAKLSFRGTKRGIIKFDNVKFSVGINYLSAYKSTGEFVVEKEEIYKISISICDSNNSAHFYII